MFLPFVKWLPLLLPFQSLWQEKSLSSHMEKKQHLFHWTKKSFSLLNVPPLTGEVMALDHVHLHAAVNQECHIPHTPETPSVWNKMQ